MAASTAIKGTAVVWSVGSITWTGGIASTTNAAFPQKVDFSKSADSSEIKDSNGDTATKIFHNAKNTLSVTIIPAAASSTHTTTSAYASASAWMPAIGAGVTITGDSQGYLTGQQGGKFYVTSAKESRTVDGAVSIDVELEQYVANDLSVTAS